MSGDDENYIDGRLDLIEQAARAGHTEDVVRLINHVRLEAGPELADVLTRKLAERGLAGFVPPTPAPPPPKKKSQLWPFAIAAAVGAMVTIAVVVPVTKLGLLAAPAATVTVTPEPPPPSTVTLPPTTPSQQISSTAPPRVAPTNGPAVEQAGQPDTYSSGSVELSTSRSWGLVARNEGSWYESDTFDLNVHNGLLSPGASASMVLVGPARPTYQDCRARTDYGGPVPMDSQVPSGSHVCIKIRENRVGHVRVDYQRDSDGKIDKVQLSGLVWRPK